MAVLSGSAATGSVGVASSMADATAYAVVTHGEGATENVAAIRWSAAVIGGAEAPKPIVWMVHGATDEHNASTISYLLWK